MGQEAPQGLPARGRAAPRPWLTLQTAIFAAVAVGVLVFVLYPVLSVLKTSVVSGPNDPTLTLQWYRKAFGDPNIRTVLTNTGVLVVFSVPLSVLLGTLLAVIIARTNVPLSGPVLNFIPVVSLFVPPLIGAMGWVFLLAPRTGLINVVLRAALGLEAASGPFSIYTVSGVVWASTIYLTPYTYLLALAALQSMDPTLEEASRVAGAGSFRTITRVTLPLIAPALFAAVLVVSMMALAEFSVPLILGAPFKFDVLTMTIWRRVNASYPPDFTTATALGSLLLITAVAGIFMQGLLVKQGRYTTIGGKASRGGRLNLGLWRYAAAAVVLGYVLVAVVLPIIGVLYVSILRYWTPAFRPELVTFVNFRDIITGNQAVWNALRNSLLLGLAGATVGIILAALVAYIVLRTQIRGRGLLEYVAMLPSGLPHIVLGLGFLLVFLRPPLRLYGTMWAVLIAYIVLFLPQATRATTAAFHQLGRELEEASAVSGVSWGRTFAQITLPLLAPGLWSGWTMLFILMFRELPASALLVTGNTAVVSTLIIDIWENAGFPRLAAFSLVILVANIGVVMVAQRLAARKHLAEAAPGAARDPG